jgi:hypothetical protein
MSQEQEKITAEDSSAPNGLSPEPELFELGYEPTSLPRIEVPDLPDDARGLTAEALANVPTLTEQVDEAPGRELVDEPALANAVEAVPSAPEVTHVKPEPKVELDAALIQAMPVQADTWGEELQVRMGKLTGDIYSLNARLDRLEERNKTKA